MPNDTEQQRPYRDLGRYLARARLATHLTQRQAADRLGISHGYLPRIESGTRRPDPQILQAMAKLYSVDYEEIAALAGYITRPLGGQYVWLSPEELENRAFFRVVPDRLKRWVLAQLRAGIEPYPLSAGEDERQHENGAHDTASEPEHQSEPQRRRRYRRQAP